MILGLVLSGLTAVGTNLAFLFKHRGAAAAPAVDIRHPLRSAIDLFRVPAWSIGWGIALVAWTLHVWALTLAPISVVQAVISGGLVFLAVLAERFFGFHLGRRQWIGLAITAVGLAFLALTGGASPAARRADYSLAALIAFEAGVLAASALVVALSVRLERLNAREGLLLGAAAGALFGVSNVAIKYLALPASTDILTLVSPWTLAALVASVIAFYSSARGLQLGPGIPVITVTTVGAHLAAIVGGIIVFRDTIGHGPLEIIGRMAAFGLVVLGAGVMPGPVRAGHELSGDGEDRARARASAGATEVSR